jgi:hypothetical protein
MGSVRRGHNKNKTKLTRDNNGKFGRVVKRAGGPKTAEPKAVGVLVKRTKDTKKKPKPQPVKLVKPSKVRHNHHAKPTPTTTSADSTDGTASVPAAE